MKGITKGEWVMYNLLNYETTISADGVRIAEVKSYPNALNDPTTEEMIENARLICTAGNLTNAGYNIEAMPQLVEALVEALPAIQELDGEFQDGWTDTIIKVKKAIKSAKL